MFTGLLCDLLWSDPDKDVQGWGENDRGVSFTFGADVVGKFLNRHDLDLICRAHQVIIQFKWTLLLISTKTAIHKVLFCVAILNKSSSCSRNIPSTWKQQFL